MTNGLLFNSEYGFPDNIIRASWHNELPNRFKSMFTFNHKYIRRKPTVTIRLCSICIPRLLLVSVMCQDTVFLIYYSSFQHTIRVKCALTVMGILLLLSCLIYLAHIRMSALMTGMSQLYLSGLHFTHHWSGQHGLLRPISPSAKRSLLTSLSNLGKNPCINTVDVLVSHIFFRQYDSVSKYLFTP